MGWKISLCLVAHYRLLPKFNIDLHSEQVVWIFITLACSIFFLRFFIIRNGRVFYRILRRCYNNEFRQILPERERMMSTRAFHENCSSPKPIETLIVGTAWYAYRGKKPIWEAKNQRGLSKKKIRISLTHFIIYVCVCVRQYNMIAVRAGRYGGDQLKAARAYVS